MQPDTIDLAAFDDSHLDGAVLLSREAGWPHRREEWVMALALGRGIVALQGGTVMGTALMTPFGDAAATISAVIVAKAARGRGLGRRLMDAALAAAAPRECRLVATSDGLPLYEKLGFASTHRIHQHQGIVAAGDPGVASDLSWADADSFETIAPLDRLTHGLDRSEMLRLLIRIGRIALLRSQERVVGYAVLRAFGRGEVIGPVIAQTPEDARALISFCIAGRTQPFLRIDTAEGTGLSPWLVELGLADVGGGIAMRRGQAAPEPAGPFKPFALASQALG